jgi:hypothetical protein
MFKACFTLGIFNSEQNRTEQNRTEQNRTEQYSTKQNGPDQNRMFENGFRLPYSTTISLCPDVIIVGYNYLIINLCCK